MCHSQNQPGCGLTKENNLLSRSRGSPVGVWVNHSKGKKRSLTTLSPAELEPCLVEVYLSVSIIEHRIDQTWTSDASGRVSIKSTANPMLEQRRVL
jgi:hypothetical protein